MGNKYKKEYEIPSNNPKNKKLKKNFAFITLM